MELKKFFEICQALETLEQNYIGNDINKELQRSLIYQYVNQIKNVLDEQIYRMVKEGREVEDKVSLLEFLEKFPFMKKYGYSHYPEFLREQLALLVDEKPQYADRVKKLYSLPGVVFPKSISNALSHMRISS